MYDAGDEGGGIGSGYTVDLVSVTFDVDHSSFGTVDWNAGFQFVDTSTVVHADDHLATELAHALEKESVTFVE